MATEESIAFWWLSLLSLGYWHSLQQSKVYKTTCIICNL